MRVQGFTVELVGLWLHGVRCLPQGYLTFVDESLPLSDTWECFCAD